MHQTARFLDDVRSAWHLCQRSVDALQRSLPELLCWASKWKKKKIRTHPPTRISMWKLWTSPHSSVYTVCVNILPQQHCVCEHDFNSGPFNVCYIVLQLGDFFPADYHESKHLCLSLCQISFFWTWSVQNCFNNLGQTAEIAEISERLQFDLFLADAKVVGRLSAFQGEEDSN